MTIAARCLCVLLALGMPGVPFAQQREAANSVFLVAKPGLADPNFFHTVVLATQTDDGGTVGVILNRPTHFALRELLPDLEGKTNYREPVFFGGPVMLRAVVALFRAKAPPAAPAFHVLPEVYLSMHPDNIGKLLADPAGQYRLFVGFSGWAPRQLESELERDGWYVLPADADMVFRKDTGALWPELVARARMLPVRGPAR